MEQSPEDHKKEAPIVAPSSPILEGHAEDLVDHYWGSIGYVAGLIKASEIKAGLILSFYGILFNIIYKNLELVMDRAVDHHFLYILLTLWFILTISSIFFSIRCFMPRIEGKFDKNVFFFNDVISNYGDINEFSKTFYKISLDQDELFHQLGQQIFINSKIASIKFKYVNRSIQMLALGLLSLFGIAICYAYLGFGS
jgi:hypothetical protein